MQQDKDIFTESIILSESPLYKRLGLRRVKINRPL